MVLLFLLLSLGFGAAAVLGVVLSVGVSVVVVRRGTVWMQTSAWC